MITLPTYSGKRICPVEPKPEQIVPSEIPIVLARVPRFGGHTRITYSVGDHSIRVAQRVEERCIAKLAAGEGDGPQGRDLWRLKLAALLHDAHEAYSGFGDVQKPAKELFPGLKEIERGLDVVIAEVFGFSPNLFEHPEIKAADTALLHTEFRDLWAGERREIPEALPARIVPRSEFDTQVAFGRMMTELVELGGLTA